MSANNKRKHQELVEGTQVLWSTLTYVPVILFGILTLNAIEPFAAPYAEESKPAPMGFLYALIALTVIAGPLVLRHQVWRPIRRLAKECGDGAVFRAYCLHIFRKAYPFVPLMAVPVIMLCLSIGGWFFYVQLGAIILADHLIDRWRAQPIEDAVNGLLQD